MDSNPLIVFSLFILTFISPYSFANRPRCPDSLQLEDETIGSEEDWISNNNITNITKIPIEKDILGSNGGEWMVSRELRESPQVNITIPVEGMSWFTNETYALLHNNDAQVALLCVAPYPIQWIESYPKDSDGFEMSEKNLWNERIIDLNGGETEGTFRSSLIMKHRGAICYSSNFSCQHVDNPCIQTNALMTLNKETDILTVQVTTQHFSYTEDNMEVEEKEGGCKAFVSYWLNTGRSVTGWKCEAASGQIITEHSEFSVCDSAAHCSIYFQHHQQGLKCLRKLTTGSCFHCAYINPELFRPGFVNCRYHGILLAQHYFYSVPQSGGQVPTIYFSWDEADAQKMLRLEELPKEIFLGDYITVYCQVSRYYFAYGHRFAYEYENGAIEYEEPDDGVFMEMYNVNRMNSTIELFNNTLRRVYCLAPVWNSTEWVNQSAVIRVRTDPLAPTFDRTRSEEDQDDIEETIFLYSGQVNMSILCNGDGRPTPTISWIKVVSDAKFHKSSEMNTSESQLTFPYVNEAIEGDYECEIENFLGTKRKVFHVVVLERYRIFVTMVTIVTFCVLAVCSVVMLFCWRKIKAQRKEIRLLTEAEVREFMDGNLDIVMANDYLDTSDLIHALPYNPKFEIPKEMIHIDESMVLGSGNFGQVLKGSIQVLNNQNGGQMLKNALKGMSSIDVAVKRVKHNMEVLYFKTLLSEVKIMAYIGKHPNIVTLVGACTQNIRKREIFIAVEFCTHGSIENFLRRFRKSFVNLVKDDFILSEPPSTQNSYENVEENDLVITTHNLIKWSREVANGMDFLGSKKIIHGDLASRNVFLTEELVTKIGDFGLSRQLLEYSNYVKSQECPVPWKWMAVESLQDMKFSVCSDIWAYGVTIWEFFTLAQTPYPGVSFSLDFVDQLNNGMRMHKPSYATSKIYNIMLDCWSLEPMSRPSFTNIKNFFDRTVVASLSQDYFQPTFPVNIHPNTESKELNLMREDSNNTFIGELNSVDTSDGQDTQGYLIPLIESHIP